MKNLIKLKQICSKLSILYIEDDTVLQEKLTKNLKQIFSTVHHAYDGTAGFKQYLKYKPDIVLTDLTLSKKNSFSMIMEMIENNEEIKIIVLSEIDDNYELIESLEINQVELLSKPLNIRHLHTEILQTLMSDFQNSESYKCTKLFNLAISNQTTIKCINSYKGIILNNNVTLLLYQNNILKIKINPTQFPAIIYENQIILYIDNTYILCELVNNNSLNNILTFTNPQIINSVNLEDLHKNIQVDNSFKTTISYKNKSIEVKPIDVSYKNIAIEYSGNLEFEIGENIDLTIGFEIEGPSTLINEKKFTKIFAIGNILKVNSDKNIKKIIIDLTIKKAGQNVFKKYLQEREIIIIKEFKKKLLK